MKYRRTKIVCTIGPSSWNANTVKAMYEAGMNVARINGAFADVAELQRVEKLIRDISPRIALMLDIKGHEVRLNKFSEALPIRKGDIIIMGKDSTENIFPATFPNLYKDIKVGQKIMMDKGAAGLEVVKITTDGKIHAKVLFGDKIAPGKGMNFPGAKLSNEAITDIDKEQIGYCGKAGWEFVSASFIRNTHDIQVVKEAFGDSKINLIAKIEDQQGVDNIDDIIEHSDGIMIARGDLGSELPLEKLPRLQKQIIHKCNQKAKPVILATNLLESMTVNIFPTRAEVTDVANGVMEGTDSLMTSGETAQGKYPIESVEMLDKIAKETEQYLEPMFISQTPDSSKKFSLFPAHAIYESSMDPEVDKILVISETGIESKILSRYNLAQPIVAFVSDRIYQNQLNLTKNVQGYVFTSKQNDKDIIVKELIQFALKEKLILNVDRVIITGKVNDKDSNSPYLFEYFDVSKSL